MDKNIDSEVNLKVTLRQLQLFVATADSGSITAASERLYLSQTAISLAIAQLEKALATTLFVRRRAHGVTLTGSGRNLLPMAREVLSSAEALQVEAGSGAAMTGHLTIGCFASLGPQLLPPLLIDFQAAYPEARVDFKEAPFGVLQSELETGALDVILSYDLGVPTELPRLLFGALRPGALISEDHPLAREGDGTVSLRELANEPFILLETSVSENHSLSVFESVGLIPRPRFRSSNFETIRSLVGRGIGWSLTMQRPETPLTHEGRNVRVLDLNDPEIRTVDVVALHSPHITLSRVAAAFLQMLEDVRPR